MTVAEMHLAIQQGVDKINSLQADMLLAQEIDIELNKSMIRFINTKYGKNNKYGKGFEESQKRIDDLRTLVREYEAPVTYKGIYNNTISIDQFKLPADYLYLVNQRSEVLINNCDKISFTLDTQDDLYYFIYPFKNFWIDPVTGSPVTGTTSGFLQGLQILADPNDPTLGMLNATSLVTALQANVYSYPSDIETLRTDLLDSSNFTPGVEFYWETYGQLNVPGSFIITVDANSYPWLNWDNSVTNTVSNTNAVTQLMGGFETTTGYEDPSNPVAYIQYVDDFSGSKRMATTISGREYSFNKFIQQDDIHKLLEDPFNTTKYTSPLTTIRQDYIDIYTSDIFIIDKVKITYIRQPRRISLPLGIDCELPIHTHQEIVDMTVSSILEGISDPRYKTHQIEVGKNE